MCTGAALEQKGESVGQGGESLAMVGSDNPSPMLMVFLTSAGVLNLPTLGLAWLVLLAHSCPSVPHSACSRALSPPSIKRRSISPKTHPGASHVEEGDLGD